MIRFGFFPVVLLVAVSCVSCATSPRIAANPGKLHLAAQSGDISGMDAALKSGSDVNQADGHGKTPLSYAAALPNIPVVEVLLDKGADPNYVAADGDTPLLVASRKANRPVVELLIRRGARIDSLGDDGFTGLAIATTRGDKELFDQLLKLGAKPNVSHANCDTALIKSISLKDPYFFDRLISAGADPNMKGRAGNTPLIIAAFANKPEIVAKLLSAGARVNDLNDATCSALLFAAGLKGIDPDIAKSMVEQGADVNQTTRDGLTPLKVACQAGHSDMVVYLYEKGANINFEDPSDEGVELNGKIHHILGDYFLAQDNCDKARASYGMALSYYRKVVDQCNGELTSLAWKQVGVIMLQALASTSQSLAQSAASSHQANMQSRQFAQIAGMKHAEQTRTGIQGYYSYMTKYNQTYVPTYRGVNMASLPTPSANAPLDMKKAYAKEKARQFEDRSKLVGNVLECFDKNPGGGAVLHACVDTVTRTFSATGTKKE